ncbi:hypothetical protein D3C87_1153420 [compost metagenome]
MPSAIILAPLSITKAALDPTFALITVPGSIVKTAGLFTNTVPSNIHCLSAVKVLLVVISPVIASGAFGGTSVLSLSVFLQEAKANANAKKRIDSFCVFILLFAIISISQNYLLNIATTLSLVYHLITCTLTNC